MVKVYSSSAYDGFGLAYTHAADTGTFDGTESGFGGQWGYYRESTTGQYLLGHRYYDPQRGRFVNRDPLGYGGGINLYGFTGNNPVNNQDPSGFGPDGDDDDISDASLHPGMHQGTARSNTARAMTKSLISTLWGAVIGVINPEGRAAEALAGGVQAFRATRPLSSPHYSVAFEARLQKGVHYPGRSALSHFAEANRQLHADMQANPEYAQQLEHMYPGIGKAVSPGRKGAFSRQPPPDASWHHHATREGVLQLMPRSQHSRAGILQSILHPGGKGGM